MRFMQDVCPLRAVRDGAWRDDAFAAAYRRQAAELGWCSMLVPESLGGVSVPAFSSKGKSDRTGKIASAEYRIELDEHGVLRHSDFRITKVMDAFIKDDSEKLLLAARAHAIARKIPDLVIDASGVVTGPTELDETLRNLLGTEPEPELLAFTPLLAKFWYAWCQSFLGLPVSGPGSRGVVRVVHDLLGGEQFENDAEFACEKHPDLAGHWMMSLESRLVNPPQLPLSRAVQHLLKDPELRVDDLLAQPVVAERSSIT